MNKMFISIMDIITSSGKFLDRKKSKELTAEVLHNMDDLQYRVNGLLNDVLQGTGLESVYKAILSSGFRPSSINAKTPNAAKKSAHMSGKGLDIEDDENQTLANLIRLHPHLLQKWGLMMEDLKYTKGKNTNWVHLDTVKRSHRDSFTFIPV